jgi:hypothetical protein
LALSCLRPRRSDDQHKRKTLDILVFANVANV